MIEGDNEEGQRQRKKVKPYHAGDVVEVLNTAKGVWFDDGEVIDVVSETDMRDGINVQAGSVKVVFANGTMSEWVPPGQIENRIRKSSRPTLPEVKCGMLD